MWQDALASLSFVDLLNLDRFNVRRDPFFCAEIERFLGFVDAYFLIYS